MIKKKNITEIFKISDRFKRSLIRQNKKAEKLKDLRRRRQE